MSQDGVLRFFSLGLEKIIHGFLIDYYLNVHMVGIWLKVFFMGKCIMVVGDEEYKERRVLSCQCQLKLYALWWWHQHVRSLLFAPLTKCPTFKLAK